MHYVDIAIICHEANRALCITQGAAAPPPTWFAATPQQRQSAVAGVEFCANNPGAPASAQHEAWMQHKLAQGWTHGAVKSDAALTHPCLLPYAALPRAQQAKDHLFIAVCRALLPYVDAPDDWRHRTPGQEAA